MAFMTEEELEKFEEPGYSIDKNPVGWIVWRCNKCKRFVAGFKNRPDKIKNFWSPLPDLKHLAFEPQRLKLPELPKMENCLCKQVKPTEEIAQEYKTACEQIKKANEDIERLRMLCPHKEWTLSNFGDYRNSSVHKFCKACNQVMEAPTQQERDDWMKENENKFRSGTHGEIIGKVSSDV